MVGATQIDVVELTQRLIACPSHAEAGERDVAMVVQEAMTALGYEDVTVDELGNVTGVVRGDGRSSGSIVFDAHMDTVGVGDPDAWMTDPYQGTRIADRLHGRGSADMKGALAAMIVGIARLIEEPPACDIVVSASIAEELVEGYALGAVLDRYPAKAVIIGEATDLHIARAAWSRRDPDRDTRHPGALLDAAARRQRGQAHGAGDQRALSARDAEPRSARLGRT